MNLEIDETKQTLFLMSEQLEKTLIEDKFIKIALNDNIISKNNLEKKFSDQTILLEQSNERIKALEEALHIGANEDLNNKLKIEQLEKQFKISLDESERKEHALFVKNQQNLIELNMLQSLYDNLIKQKKRARKKTQKRN